MKTRTLLTLSALLAGSASIAGAQSLVAGWDFTNNGLSGTSTEINATFSDFGTSDTEGGSQSNGTIDLGLAFPNFNASTDYQMSANQTIDFLDNRNAINDSFGGEQGIIFQTAGATANTEVFTLSATSNDGTLFNEFDLTFGVGLQNDTSASITVEYSLDDSTYTTFGSESVSTSIGDNGQTLAYNTGTVANTDTIYFRATLAGLDANGHGMAFDNMQVGGTVVPEPSAFALIAGLVVIGSVAARRRKCS